MGSTTAAAYLAQALDRYGVTAVFLVPTILSATLYEIEQRTSIKRIVTHGEKAAAYMADGYARASGRPGVCMAQQVGAANLAAGIRDARLACAPVVALTGGVSPETRYRRLYQQVEEEFPIFAPYTKYSARVDDGRRLPEHLTAAMRAAVTGQPGPVHLELSGHAGEDVEGSEVAAAPPDVAELSTPLLRPHPDVAVVRQVVELLRNAQRPMIVAGGGVRASGAEAELVALAERMDVPVAATLTGKDVIASDHPLSVGVTGLYARRCANELVLEADLVFIIGSQTGSQPTLSWQIPPPTTPVIQLDIEPAELGSHYQGALPLHGDAKVTLRAMLEAAAPGDHAAWRARAQELVARWRSDSAALLESDDVPIRPERVMGDLSNVLPSDAIVVSDTGHAGMWTGGYLDLKHPEQRFLRATGSLGWALPAAIGAQVAAPQRPVVLFTGDGGFWYHIAELETAARWQIPVVLVVNNNRSLNQEIGVYSPVYGGQLHGRHTELWHFNDVDFSRVGEAMGVTSFRVTKPADFAPTMERAFATGAPVIVDVVTDINALAPKGTTDRAER